MKVWREMLVGGRGAIDLGRHDRVRHVEIVGPRFFVEAHHVVAELASRAIEELAPARERGKNGSHVVRRPSHEPVRTLGPEAMDRPPPREVFRGARNEPHGADPLSALRVDARGDLRGEAGGMVAFGDAADRFGESRVRGDIVDALTVEENRAPVLEACDVVGRLAHGALSILRGLLSQRVDERLRGHEIGSLEPSSNRREIGAKDFRLDEGQESQPPPVRRISRPRPGCIVIEVAPGEPEPTTADDRPVRGPPDVPPANSGPGRPHLRCR